MPGELIKFESLEYADAKLTKQRRKTKDSNDINNAAMIKFLLGDLKGGLNLLKEWKESARDAQPWFQAWFEKVCPLFARDNITKRRCCEQCETGHKQAQSIFLAKAGLQKNEQTGF